MTSVNRVYRHLECYISQKQNQATDPNPDFPPPETPNSAIPFALDILCTQFGLSACDRDILLLCVGMELDPDFPSLCCQASGDSQINYPTLSLALSVLPNINLSVLGRQSPLQYWQLIEIAPGVTLTQSPLRIDSRILCYLLGEPSIDAQLDERVKLLDLGLTGELALPPSHQQIAQIIASAWSESTPTSKLPIIELSGSDLTTKRRIAAEATTLFGCSIRRMSATVLPSDSTQLHQLRRRWEREAILTNCVLFLECDSLNMGDTLGQSLISQFIAEINTPVILSSQQRLSVTERSLTTYDIPKLTLQEQRSLFFTYLADNGNELNGDVNRLIAQFNLSQSAIHSVCTQAIHQVNRNDHTNLGTTLWNTSRHQARPRLDALAQRIETPMTWDDLILPESQLKTLQEIVAHTRQRAKVYQDWGMGGKQSRGLGLTALFYGQSGTGKTTAAEIIAKELHLDLYRIDLSAVVSKYIGETEKNLAQIFDAAEVGGVVLLFDEADSLFAKRGQVKEARDRYANQEVSYLLQRLESYQGLAILTTNLRDSIDSAFERRLRFVLEFPFPDAMQREQIWRRVFPKSTPTRRLNFEKLARLAVSGGSIHNIALAAAFLAAEASEPVGMKHLLAAAQTEGIKMQIQTVISVGTQDWLEPSKSKSKSKSK